MQDAMATVQSFLLAFSALFSIVNPIGTAFIFSQVTADRSHAERAALAGRIGLYALLVMLFSLWAGTYIISFFGISLAALRIAGGLVVAAFAWQLLSAPEQRDARKQRQADAAVGEADVAFFPLTMPLTTGPGTISVAVALGASRPEGGARFVAFFIGTSAAAAVIAVLIWLAFRWADRLTGILGETRVQVASRLSAFLLLCLGTQIMLGGVIEVASMIRRG